jgi:hypothetical protein
VECKVQPAPAFDAGAFALLILPPEQQLFDIGAFTLPLPTPESDISAHANEGLHSFPIGAFALPHTPLEPGPASPPSPKTPPATTTTTVSTGGHFAVGAFSLPVPTLEAPLLSLWGQPLLLSNIPPTSSAVDNPDPQSPCTSEYYKLHHPFSLLMFRLFFS